MQDEKEIHAVISDYFEALYHGDVAKFRKVLHPQVRLFSATDGVLVNLDLETYMAMVASRPSPASRNDPREEAVLSVEVASPTTDHRPCPGQGHVRAEAIHQRAVLHQDRWPLADHRKGLALQRLVSRVICQEV
jgi:hypothetical protein